VPRSRLHKPSAESGVLNVHGIGISRLRELTTGEIAGGVPFHNRLFGSVQWSKDLGRPADGRLSTAVVIEHMRWITGIEVIDRGDGRIIKIPDAWQSVDDVIVWDGKGTAEQHEVTFSCSLSGVPMNDDKVLVRAAEAGWERSHPEWGSGPRVVDPPEQLVDGASGVAFVEFVMNEQLVIRDHR
jgi:hypothetical protein